MLHYITLIRLRSWLAGLLAIDSKLAQIQVMRAFAAVLVCFGHILEESQRMSPSPYLETLLRAPWGLGVDIFFIISGFIMMYTSYDTFGRPQAFKKFITRRIIRIVPPYWFFTSVIVGIVLLMPAMLDSTTFTVGHAVMSYFFIPHLEPGAHAQRLHPILGLGWTLVYEMFFYTVFAFVLMFSRRIGLAALATIFGVFFIGAREEMWGETLNIFWKNSIMLEFLLGVLIGLLAKKSDLNRGDYSGLLVLGAMGIALTYLIPELGQERFFRLGMPALLLFCLMYRMRVSSTPFWGILILVSNASYTLYLSHPFALTAVKVAMNPLLAFGAYHPALIVVYIFTALFTAICGAIIFYALFEKPVTTYLQAFARNHRLA